MKKFLLILCVTVLLCGCEKTDTVEHDSLNLTAEAQAERSEENKYETVDEGQYYRLKRGDGAYFYEILDGDGNIVRSDGSYTKEPHISMLDDSVVKVSYQAGTGLSTRWTFYYDTANDAFSPVYYSVFGESDGRVIYRSGSSIMISDIFDKTKYYREINKFKYPIAEAAEPFVNAEIDDSVSMIKIIYLTGDDFEEVTEYFDIGDNGWKGAYKAALETFRLSGDYSKSSKFSLCDINGDDVPELFISEGAYRIASCQIYSYHNGLIGLGEYGTYGDVLFKPNLSLITGGDLHWGYDYSFEYSLSDDFVFVLEKSFYNNYGAAASPEEREYKIDDEPVSAEEYQAELDKYHDDDSISLGWDYDFTDEDISKALALYK